MEAEIIDRIEMLARGVEVSEVNRRPHIALEHNNRIYCLYEKRDNTICLRTMAN